MPWAPQMKRVPSSMMKASPKVSSRLYSGSRPYSGRISTRSTTSPITAVSGGATSSAPQKPMYGVTV